MTVLSMCLCILPIRILMPKQILMELGMYIMAAEPISKACFIDPSKQSMCLYVYPPVVGRQRLGKSVTAATNIQATIEESLEASFSMPFVPYQRKW
jgi:hypothetical protein